jgi:hypothetical protein
VLIEGPRDATPLIEHLAHPQTRAPVALYTTFVDKANSLKSERHDAANPARFAAYYPLADFSPELAAIRAGMEAGAQVRFIDLTFPELVLAERAEHPSPDEEGKPQPPLRSLFDEHYLRHSKLLQALCDKTGARDPDDLWDHLFEAGFQTTPRDDFLRAVETYCGLARAYYTPQMLEAEGNTEREAAMAAEIRAALAEFAAQGRPVLVVTGGFHTPGLRQLLAAPAPPHKQRRKPAGEAQTLLVRYGFAQLDRLNGYASGMPSPAFYQRVWQHTLSAEGAGDSAPADAPALASQAHACSELIVELGRRARGKGMGVSTADEIAALTQTRQLAAFRGHPQPTREDLLDGIRSAFVKGALNADGALMLAQAQELLAGDEIGDLPPGVAVAPLVADFRATAARLRIDLTSLAPREMTLDIYRSPAHRTASRFFFRLLHLGVPFATHVQGPDFVAGRELSRVQEVWRYQWTPGTESALAESSLYGATLEEACAARLQEQMSGSKSPSQQGLGRRADFAAGLLLSACRMGLHRFAPELLAHTAALIMEDGLFVSLVQTAEQLLVLHLSREPLEAHDLPGVIDAAIAAYQRACFLLPALAGTPEQEEGGVIDALNALRQVALSLGDLGAGDLGAVHPLHELRRNGMRALLNDGNANPVLRGAAAGGLYADGDLPREDLVRLAGGELEFGLQSTAAPPSAAPAGDNQPRARLRGPAFLRGLLQADRSCVWQAQELLAELNRVMCGWDPATFVRALPELRLAFAGLTARECDTVARSLATLVGAREAPSLYIQGAGESDILLGADLDRRVADLLRRDGLLDWAQALRPPQEAEEPR